MFKNKIIFYVETYPPHGDLRKSLTEMLIIFQTIENICLCKYPFKTH